MPITQTGTARIIKVKFFWFHTQLIFVNLAAKVRIIAGFFYNKCINALNTFN